MQLRNVEMFCEVVAQRSFSKAAVLLHVSQSSASQAVHMLEKRLGVELIDRTKRPFDLTPAGELYYEGCRDLLENYRSIEDRVQRMRDRVVGSVRVAAIYSVDLQQMDAYAKRFEELYPDAALDLRYHHPDEVYEKIHHDEADIGLVSFPRCRGELTAIPWQSQPMVVTAYPGHRLAGRESMPVSELEGESFVGFTPELQIRSEIDRWLKQAGVSVNVVHEFDNIENIKRDVEIGSGVALLPAETVRREEHEGLLATVALSDVDWQRPLGIIHKRHRRLTAAVSKFIELLHEYPASVAVPAPGPGRIRDAVGGAAHAAHVGDTSSRRAANR